MNHARSDSSSTVSATECVSFSRACGRRVRLEDAGLGLDDLAERPERDPLPVRETAALSPAHEIGAPVDLLAKLPDEAALPHSRLPDDRDELCRRLARAHGRTSRRGAPAPNRAPRRASPRVARCRRRSGCVRAMPARPGIGACFPLAATGSSGSNADRALRRPHRRRIDDDGADGRCALQARRRVDDVARDHALPPLRARTERRRPPHLSSLPRARRRRGPPPAAPPSSRGSGARRERPARRRPRARPELRTRP